MPRLSACIQEGRVILHLQAQKKMEAIRELASRLEGPDKIVDVKRFLSLVMQREKIETTAVGHGVAIPHAHGDCVKPVGIVVMIASPVRHFQDYLKAVSRVARLLNQEESLQRILNAQSAAEVIEVFKQIDRL